MKRSFYNILSAILSKAVTVLGPFLVRTLIIYKLGNEYVGLNSLFTSILSVLSLAELGIGSVLTFSMYDPVQKGDNKKLCTLLNFYRTVYKCIGAIIIVIAVIVTPVIPKLINGSYPADINIYLLFWVYITNTSISYLLYGYRSSVLIAYRRNNVFYNVQMTSSILMYLCQSIVLLAGFNFYAYIAFLPLSTLLNNVIVYCISQKQYPEIQPQGILEKTERREIFNQIKSLSIHRIAGTIILSTDSLVISAILGLNPLAIYANYIYIFTAINGFIDVALISITSTIGNRLLISSKEEKYQLFRKISFYVSLIVSFCAICMFNGYQAFIELWVGKNNLLSIFEMSWFCIYFYSYKFRSILMTFRDAAGLWEQDIWKSIIGMILNVILDIVLVKMFGLIGVLVATSLIMVLIFYPWEVHVLFRYMFGISSKYYVSRSILITFITVISSGLVFSIVHMFSYSSRFAEFIVAVCISAVVFVVMCSIVFIKNEDYAFIVHKITRRNKGIK